MTNRLDQRKSLDSKDPTGRLRGKLYELGFELYEELNSLGFIRRLDEIAQLGLIKVPARFRKTRLDYIELQLTLHKLIRESAKLPDQRMKVGYSTRIQPEDFGVDLTTPLSLKHVTVADCLQILCLVHSLGHFYLTFTASRAVIMAGETDTRFLDWLLESFDLPHLKSLARTSLEDKNYHRFHLINSLMALERCDQKKDSVKVAQSLLLTYLQQEESQINKKLKDTFAIFRAVRQLSYLAYDLPMAKIPFIIDLEDGDSLIFLFQELLGTYNDNMQARDLLDAMNKLLSDSLYNEASNCICHYQIARQLSKRLVLTYPHHKKGYFGDLWLEPQSCLNKKPRRRKDFDQSHVLKLTFTMEEKRGAMVLLTQLEKMKDVRVGYYDRHGKGLTLLLSLRQGASGKRNLALRVLKVVVQNFKKMGLEQDDNRFLLVTKYFLYYLFNERKLEIIPTLHDRICVLYTQGSRKRLNAVKRLLDASRSSPDILHEGMFLYSRLKMDHKNDTSLILPCSIIVYRDDGQMDAEFDGLIIHPNRKRGQVIFLEAKNTKSKPEKARNELKKSLQSLGLGVSKDDLVLIDHDCFYAMTL